MLRAFAVCTVWAVSCAVPEVGIPAVSRRSARVRRPPSPSSSQWLDAQNDHASVITAFRARFPADRNQAITRSGLSWTRTSDTRRSRTRSEEHTSELPSLMRTSYSVFCLKKKKPYVATQTYNFLHLLCILYSSINAHHSSHQSHFEPHY